MFDDAAVKGVVAMLHHSSDDQVDAAAGTAAPMTAVALTGVQPPDIWTLKAKESSFAFLLFRALSSRENTFS
jgi:hypothetical protein